MENVDNFLKRHFEHRAALIEAYGPRLSEAMRYSLFSGGKRFRPSLCLETCAALSGEFETAVPYAAALEMIHTYSLIHDDLPCMDNDDLRRGQATNHKKFGEALALLAGDALLTESFYIIASHYGEKTARLVQILADAAGPAGMVGGQAMDMGFGDPIDSVTALEIVQRGKTAALIAAAAEGGAVIASADEALQKKLCDFGFLLGLCFQIKDDLLDANQDDPQDAAIKNYIHHIGESETQKLLQHTTQKARALIDQLPPACQRLAAFLDFNSTREK